MTYIKSKRLELRATSLILREGPFLGRRGRDEQILSPNFFDKKK
jgi:hypothetical protein